MTFFPTKIFAFFAGLAIATAATFAQALAQATPAPSPTPARWQFRVTPYLWAPTVNGALHFEHNDIAPRFKNLVTVLPTSADIKIGPNSYLSNLNSAVELAAEARKGDGGFFTDFIYLNATSGTASVVQLTGPLGKVVVPLNISASGRLTDTLWTVAVTGAPIPQTGPSSFDVLGGFRYYSVSAKANWSLGGPLGLINPTGSASKSVSDIVPIVGIKGRAALGPHFYLPYYFDAGASSSVTTMQWVFGFGYQYHSGAAILAWRQLGTFAATGNSGALIQNLQLGGPLIGWTFNL